MSLMRLAYASEATFQAKPVEKGVEPHVARILMTSRKNNARDQLVGGLYYGDNRFFQYLEGDESAVRETYGRILKDERHRNVKTLIEEPITERTFSNWSMKYVPLSKDVRQFLDAEGLESFDPANFTADQCEKMIELIRNSSQDQKLVNYDDDRATGNQPQVMSGGLKAGIIVAGICIVGALLFAGSML
ncbi:Sensors of blue-light using FAD [Marinobacter gudaonensis]|uniref:Sensors of blue-light using FAD n=1 Tax=Marinobacter gudaonensis TaxID=375760 RepID=A0A1I6GLN6_9GAMM|nr:BLUF domain-containing protein [Marinobacter gudaonensis]SFR43039.1 Sensors of blue-light using FAD [Marinobacter gudaonensis]